MYLTIWNQTVLLFNQLLLSLSLSFLASFSFSFTFIFQDPKSGEGRELAQVNGRKLGLLSSLKVTGDTVWQNLIPAV